MSTCSTLRAKKKWLKNIKKMKIFKNLKRKFEVKRSRDMIHPTLW